MTSPVYSQIYQIVRKIPNGKVVTYGQISGIVGGCTARMVGYSMAALYEGTDVPWHRVINAKGMVSPRGCGIGEFLQQELLQAEGIVFDQNGKISLEKYRWLADTEGNLLDE